MYAGFFGFRNNKTHAFEPGTRKGLKLRIEMASLKFPTPDTAVEDGTTTVLAPDGTASSRARYSNFFVKTNSVLADGSKVTATNVLIPLTPDSVSVQSKEQKVNGKALPDTKETKMKRSM